jgi:hypothetical protein
MVMVAEPLDSVAAEEVKLPLVIVTGPVGVGLPVPPETETLIESDWAVVMLDKAGVTVTVGAMAVVTMTLADPVAEL